jgi:PPOX class probable FMN-dependent enzyme
MMQSITTEDELRQLIAPSRSVNYDKSIDHVDAHCARFISMSPFLTIASRNAHGKMDVSPKGDPPGFVQVLDEHTLAIPERPGNRRCDTFTNVLEEPAVALLFLVPGMDETLRVNGTASITATPLLLQSMAIHAKPPVVALLVHVEEAFIHCGKAPKRAGLWNPDTRIDRSSYPTMGEVVHCHANLDERGIPVEAAIEVARDDYDNNVY